MQRLPALAFLCTVTAFTFWSCDGDDGNDGDVTAVLASPTAPASGIIIDDPVGDATLSVPITMSGQANVFEGALTIDALGNAAGLVLCTRHVQATSGTGTPGTWEGILAFPPPADAVPITLRAYTFSAEDGSMQDLVERSVTLSNEQPAIVITSPACAADVAPGTLTVTGMALVFEAVLQVDIRNASGVVMTQTVVAASGTEFSPWTVTFDLSGLTPGFYDVVAYDLSARDGSIENEFPVQISVGP